MGIRELFLFCLFSLTLIQWVIYFKFKEWQRNRYIKAEPQQGKPVDRVLYHEISDLNLPWQAGESWQQQGRGFVVSLQRQGLDTLLDERDVDELRAVYCLGYCVREQADTREIEALSKRLKRSESHVDELRGKIAELKQKLSQRPVSVSEPQPDNKPVKPIDPLTQSWHEWGQCDKDLDELMKAKGWVRINPVSVPPVPVSVPDTEPAEQTDYSNLKGDDRKAAMTELKENGLSYSEIAKLFSVSVGCCKATISQYRKQQQQNQNNIVSIDFTESLQSVSNGG